MIAALEQRRDPGLVRSFTLAALVHLLLLAIMFLGVRWQMHPPQSVTVELWEPPAPAPKVEAPKPEPKIEPKPEPKPEPPKVEKPEIVEKAAPPKKVEKKVEPPKPKADDFKKQLREQLAREQKSIDQDRQAREAKERVAREQAAAHQKALGLYVEMIRRRVKQNWILPQDLPGNPEVVFNVVQLPSGDVISVKLAKSSGIPAYDAAVERAIIRSSPLPLPPQRELFERDLKLTFRPRD